jgi:hypothetical protein
MTTPTLETGAAPDPKKPFDLSQIRADVDEIKNVLAPWFSVITEAINVLVANDMAHDDRQGASVRLPGLARVSDSLASVVTAAPILNARVRDLEASIVLTGNRIAEAHERAALAVERTARAIGEVAEKLDAIGSSIDLHADAIEGAIADGVGTANEATEKWGDRITTAIDDAQTVIRQSHE